MVDNSSMKRNLGELSDHFYMIGWVTGALSDGLQIPPKEVKFSLQQFGKHEIPLKLHVKQIDELE